MVLNVKQVGVVQTVGNATMSGVIGIASSTVDNAKMLTVSQTYNGLTLSLPAPSDTTVANTLTIVNTGTAGFMMYGVVVLPGCSAAFAWCSSLSKWSPLSPTIVETAAVALIYA